jgi:hypothetical protein
MSFGGGFVAVRDSVLKPAGSRASSGLSQIAAACSPGGKPIHAAMLTDRRSFYTQNYSTLVCAVRRLCPLQAVHT